MHEVTRVLRAVEQGEAGAEQLLPLVYEELRRSMDEGVAEFLGLERVKPNTLGNTRMLLHL